MADSSRIAQCPSKDISQISQVMSQMGPSNLTSLIPLDDRRYDDHEIELGLEAVPSDSMDTSA